MKKLVILIFLWLPLLPAPAEASSWYYPLEKTLQRQSLKTFGQYIDVNFYKTAPDVFPTKFTGYHAGSDLEIFPDEANVDIPVYALNSGIIAYSGTVTGYGGFMLLKLDDINKTVLYGHLKTSSLLKQNMPVDAGEKIAVLGDAYSKETAGERKHLHIGIYNGTDIYFNGYENSESVLQSKWVNPLLYLKEKGANEPGIIIIKPAIKVTTTKSPAVQPPAINKPLNFIKSLSSFLTRLFTSFGR